MVDGINDLTITIDTEADRAIEDINTLQNEVKDLNAELEYTLVLLDDLEEHEYGVKPGDARLRKLGKRFLHSEPDANRGVPYLRADDDEHAGDEPDE